MCAFCRRVTACDAVDVSAISGETALRVVARKRPISDQERSLIKVLGLNAKRLREAEGMTQQEAAVAADIDLSTWQRIEGERQRSTLWIAGQVALALGVDPLDLFKPLV